MKNLVLTTALVAAAAGLAQPAMAQQKQSADQQKPVVANASTGTVSPVTGNVTVNGVSVPAGQSASVAAGDTVVVSKGTAQLAIGGKTFALTPGSYSVTAAGVGTTVGVAGSSNVVLYGVGAAAVIGIAAGGGGGGGSKSSSP